MSTLSLPRPLSVVFFFCFVLLSRFALVFFLGGWGGVAQPLSRTEHGGQKSVASDLFCVLCPSLDTVRPAKRMCTRKLALLWWGGEGGGCEPAHAWL